MKVDRHHIGPRKDWFCASDERGLVIVSLLANRNEVILDITVNGERSYDYVKLRDVAEALVAVAQKGGA